MYMMLWPNMGLGTSGNPDGSGPVGWDSSSSEPEDARASSCLTEDGVVEGGCWSSGRVVRDKGPTGGLAGGHGEGEVDCGNQSKETSVIAGIS